MKSARQTVLILVLTVVLSGGWAVALRKLPSPELAETNYEANRLRVERWLLGPPASAVLVGTSMSGRLLPGYFTGTPLAGLANLGLDGASPDTGLRLVLMRQPEVPLVLLEAHLLGMKAGPNDRQLLDLATGVGLQISSVLPLTRAEARPSTVLYSWLKERRGGDGVASEAVKPRLVSPAQAATNAAAMDPDWRPRIEALIRRLQQRGSRIVLIRLPAGRANPADPEAPNDTDLIAGQLGLPLIDLLRLSRQEKVPVTYTDGLHLTPKSARAMSELLARTLEAQGLVVPVR